VIQASQIGGAPATDDLCGGLSPCDAHDYRGDGSVGASGMCFLPPTVDNHLSDPACSSPNLPGLSGIFKLAWCRVQYADPTGATPPTIALDANGDPDCQDPEQWQDLVESSGHYVASVQWKRNEAKVGDVFRLYVVHGVEMYAHRDVVIDPNLTTPADSYVHSIGFGTEPVKVRINSDFGCSRFDTQEPGTDNAAICLIAGATNVEFDTEELDVRWEFPDGNEAFMARFEISECLSLGFVLDPDTQDVTGNALVDTPLANCKLSLSSDEVQTLDVPATLFVSLTDGRWDVGGPFENARFNVIETDEMGVGVLPTVQDPGWYGEATVDNAALRWMGRGIERVASWFLPEPLSAGLSSLGSGVSRMSDFQVTVVGVMTAATPGAACAGGAPYCTDLGNFATNDTTSVSVHVSAPTSDGPTTYPANHIDVPDTRLHFFSETDVICPAGSAQGAYGRGCVAPNSPDLSTSPPSYWDHVVVVTNASGIGTVDWAVGDGESQLYVVACGVARPGPLEPNPFGEPGSDGVWGQLGDCSDRETAMTQATYDNGPADGFTPFEPVDTQNEAAIYAPPLVFVAHTCPNIVVDGIKGANEWAACADSFVFTAPQKGPKVTDNATLFTYNDGNALYIGIEVASTELGNKMFIGLTDAVAGGDGVEAAGDEILVLDQLGVIVGGVFQDWHNTASCVNNSSSSFCGEMDAGNDGARAGFGKALLNGAGAGRVFYEFVRPLNSPGATASPKEDLGADSGEPVGVRVVVTQGQGGGKGGFVFPDPQTSSTKYHIITLD
jgi:hypothetical protein